MSNKATQFKDMTRGSTLPEPTGTTLDALSAFWRQFSREPLYDTGFADVTVHSGADSLSDGIDALRALAYIKGAADMARIACPYLGRSWQIADTIGMAAATFLTLLASGTLTHEKVESLSRAYTAELRAYVAMPVEGVQ